MRQWARRVAQRRPEVVRIGYFGSYARGDWGVGSDLDLVIIVEQADQAFERRAASWDATDLPVPADVLIYTQQEWHAMSPQSRMSRTLNHEAVWVYAKPDG